MIGRTAGNMGLSRLYCRRCSEETLHRTGGVCVHCGTRYEVAIPQNKAPVWMHQAHEANRRRIRAAKREKAQRLAIA